MIELTPSQRNYLTHMLGADKDIAPRDRGYRNRFCATIGDPADKDLTEMVGMGLVVRGAVINDGHSVFYHATEAGMDAVGLTKRQKKNAMGE